MAKPNLTPEDADDLQPGFVESLFTKPTLWGWSRICIPLGVIGYVGRFMDHVFYGLKGPYQEPNFFDSITNAHWFRLIDSAFTDFEILLHLGVALSVGNVFFQELRRIRLQQMEDTELLLTDLHELARQGNGS